MDTALVSLTQLVLKGRAFVTLPLVARQLGPDAYGVWTQVLSIATLLAPLVGLSLHQPLIRFGADQMERRASLLATTTLYTVTTCASVLVLASLAGQPLAFALLGNVKYASYLWPSLLLMTAGNFRLLGHAIYRIRGRIWIISLTNSIATIGGTVVFAYVMLQRPELLTAIIWLTSVEVVVAIAVLVHAFVLEGLARPSLDVLRECLRYSLPILVSTLSVWIMDRSDRFVIAAFDGEYAVGVYSASYALASSLMILVTPLQTTIFPRISSLWRTNRDEAERLLRFGKRFFIALAMLFVLTIPTISQPLLARLGGKEIAADATVLTLLIGLGCALWGFGSLQVLALHATMNTKQIGRVNAMGALVNIATCVALVPVFSIRGAAIATAAGYGTIVFAQARAVDFGHDDVSGTFFLRCMLAAAVPAALLYFVLPQSMLAIVIAGAAALCIYGALLAWTRAFDFSEVMSAMRRRGRE